MNNISKLNNLWYDVGYGETCTLNDIKRVVDECNTVEWLTGPSRTGDVKHTEIGSQRLQITGWQPRIDLKSGLKKCFKSK